MLFYIFYMMLFYIFYMMLFYIFCFKHARVPKFQ